MAMTSFERVVAALQGKQPDRVPVLTFLDPYTKNWATDEKSYGGLLEAVRENADVFFDVGQMYDTGIFHSAYPAESERHIQNGIMTSLFETPAGQLAMSRDIARAGYTPKHLITEPRDVEKLLSIPYVRPEPSLIYPRNHIARYREAVVPVFKLKDPVCHVGDAIDPEVFARWTIEERGLIKALLDEALRRTLDAVDYALESGIDAVFYFSGPEYCLPPLCSPADFREFVTPYDTKLLQRIHGAGKYVIIHSHGKVRQFLDEFVKMGADGLDVLEPATSITGDVDLREVKKSYGDQLCLIGNIQYADIALGDAASIERMVADNMDAAKQGGGYIIEPTADPFGVPLDARTSENFITYFKMARKYGLYRA